METLYIGAEYSRGFKHDDGSSFGSTPCVVLYSIPTKKYYVAEVSQRQGQNAYDFTFRTNTTALMLPGVYTLEIYTDERKEEMIKRIQDYVRAVRSASSPDSQDGSDS